ncbi:MAG: hypothetical protein JAZ17_23970 [Candidatus Thiodiazotropha endolucinida]|nr:hypothetical protein [Candidatus Thiodiazotropha endolucinida]
MNNRINVYYSEWLALLPLALFIVGAMYLGLSGSPDEKGFWPIITAALSVALLISKDKDVFAKYVIAGMASNLVMIMVAAWLFSSIIGVFLSEAGVVSALVEYYKSLGLGGGGFVFGVFIVAAIIGTSTGTAVGTVLIVTPVLFEAGLNIGCDEYYLIGAILGGAAFGDDFSPLSDTTIASASTQNINIGRSVKSRIKYALSAAIPASLVFILFGGNNNEIATLSSNESSLLPLIMLVAPATVVYLCLMGRHILYALLAGIIVSLATSLGFGLIEFNQVFSLDPDNFSAKSIIIDGMNKGVGISVFSILLMGLVSFVMMSGVIEKLLSMLFHRISSLRVAEFIIVFLTIFINTLLAHNTITIMAVGEVVRDISNKYQINSYRASNLMDISANTVMHMFPYMITVVLAASVANGILKDGRQIDLIAAGFHNFHSIFLLVVAIVVSFTGIWLKADERYLAQEKES